jgi:hypothetical protein
MLIRQQIVRQPSRGCEKEPIAPFQISFPLRIRSEIRDRGFAFHDPYLTIRGYSRNIGTKASNRTQFRYWGETFINQKSANPLCEDLTCLHVYAGFSHGKLFRTYREQKIELVAAVQESFLRTSVVALRQAQ